MAESGVEPTDACITTFQELKRGRKFKYILFALNDAKTDIIVDKTSNASSYEEFVDDLPDDQCRWAVYDFEFGMEGEGKRNKICFVSWSPEEAKIKDKMLFASSREALRQKLVGVAFEVQGTDRSEISYNAVLDKAVRTSTV